MWEEQQSTAFEEPGDVSDYRATTQPSTTLQLRLVLLK